MQKDHLTTAEAAARLGVKPSTLYAYVSRGLLARIAGPDGRSSRFDAAELDRIAGGRRRGTLPLVRTEISSAGPRGVWFRGADAAVLCRSRTYEEVAHWLWAGETAGRAGWTAPADLLAAARRAQDALGDAPPLRRLGVVASVAQAGGSIGWSNEDARALLATLVDALPITAPRDAGRSFAGRAWSALCNEPPSAAGLEAMNAALVLFADDAVDGPTLAARIAAPRAAGMAACVSAALAVLPGRDPDLASVRALLAGAVDPPAAAAIVREHVRAQEHPPGLGDARSAADVRAALLLDAIAGIPGRRPGIVSAAAAAARSVGFRPRAAFALGALAYVTQMVSGGATALVALARCAGWIAHAAEERKRPSDLHARVRYAGPPPSAGAGLPPGRGTLQSVLDYLAR